MALQAPGVPIRGMITDPRAPAQNSNPYNLYQAPGYTPGYVTGAANNPAAQAMPGGPDMYGPDAQGFVPQPPGLATARSGGLVGGLMGRAMDSIVPAVASGLNSFGSQINNAVQAYAQPTVDPANPYGLYQAPGYVQGQVTQGYTPYMAPSVNASGERSTAIAPERIEPGDPGPDYYDRQAAAQIQQQNQQRQAIGAAPTWIDRGNQGMYNQYVSAIKSGALPGADAYNEQGFRNFEAANTTPEPALGSAARPLNAYLKQNIIALNPYMHGEWLRMANPANPNDPSAFAQWASQNQAPLQGISAQEQYAAYQAARAKGTAPVAPTPVQQAQQIVAPQSVAPAAAPVQPAPPMSISDAVAKSISKPMQDPVPVQQAPAAAPPAQPVTLANWRDSIDGPAGQPIVTPTFKSTGAVKLPTGTVTPTATGYTASRTTTPTGPSRPGYTAPSGRVYANWVPKRKVT